MEGSTAASGAPIANATSVSTGAMINPASTARKRAQNTAQMQLVISSFMNQTPDMIDNWCTPTNHKLNVGMDKCLLSVIAYLETEVKSEDSAIYNSPVPSKEVSRPSPSISPTLSHQRRLSLRIGIGLAAGGEELDPRLDHETQNRARS